MAFNADEFLSKLKGGTQTQATPPPIAPAPAALPSAPPQGVSSAVPAYQPAPVAAPPPPRTYSGPRTNDPPSGIVMQKLSRKTGKEFFSGFITDEGFAFLQQNWGKKMGFNLNFAKQGGGEKPVAYMNFFLYAPR